MELYQSVHTVILKEVKKYISYPDVLKPIECNYDQTKKEHSQLCYHKIRCGKNVTQVTDNKPFVNIPGFKKKKNIHANTKKNFTML